MHHSILKTLALMCGFAAIVAASPAFNEYDLLVSFTDPVSFLISFLTAIR
jgi:hypothetical protein